MSANVEVYQEQFRALMDWTVDALPLDEMGINLEEIGSVLIQRSNQAVTHVATGVVGSFMSVLSNGLLVLIFLVFLLAGSASSPVASGLWGEVQSRIQRFLLTKFLVSAVTGLLVGVILAVLDVNFALAFGLLAFMLNFIPSIGSAIATLLPLPVVLLDPELGPLAKTLAIVLPGAVQFSVGNVIEPKIMGQSLDLHPVTILLALIFFGMMWGIVGMFLATPVTAVLKILLERLDLTAPVAGLMAGRLSTSGRAEAPDG